MDGIGFDLNPYHVPYYCSKCKGVMVFKGVGEYQCEECKNVEYDDFGKVRLYIETHRGANAVQIEAATGVSQKTIRLMLKENRLEISSDSKSFLYCEMCQKPIRSGRLCASCEKSFHERLEDTNRKRMKIAGFGTGNTEDAKGARRFERED